MSDVICSQLESIKETMERSDWQKVIIAYEPIWALNTGKIASADQTQESVEMIRNWMAENCSEAIAKNTRILYGGPVTGQNCENLIKLQDVDGFLVGSTSCKPVFRSIFEMIHAQAVKDL